MESTINKTLSLIKILADYYEQLRIIKATLSEIYPFEELCSWTVDGIFYNCNIEDGKLFTDKGDLLSTDGRCMDEKIPYFVNQSAGYCGDDYYGTMFIKVDDNNTFVAVDYEC